MEVTLEKDEKYMRLALEEAKLALEADEVPIGAIIVAGGRIVGRGHNMVETLTDVTAHAEIQAITAAASTIGGKYLNDCTLYVTVEPCPMCAGALAWSQIGRIVYGVSDPKRGFSTISGNILHPRTVISSGVLATECEALMKNFFAKLR
ncbi:MAG: nucleoside deaminase [Rikenellaceae bacterium]|nr:nucleoside deaminase [Rikenellaceae bacterium]